MYIAIYQVEFYMDSLMRQPLLGLSCNDRPH